MQEAAIDDDFLTVVVGHCAPETTGDNGDAIIQSVVIDWLVRHGCSSSSTHARNALRNVQLVSHFEISSTSAADARRLGGNFIAEHTGEALARRLMSLAEGRRIIVLDSATICAGNELARAKGVRVGQTAIEACGK